MANPTKLRTKAVKEAEKELKVNREKVKAAYNQDVISLEIIKTKEKLETPEEAEAYYEERVQHKIYLIDDLSENYIVRFSFTEKKQELQTVDPDHIPEGDQYELSESIQDILRENMFPVIDSNFPQPQPVNNPEPEGDDVV